jgi:hypothetical protein
MQVSEKFLGRRRFLDSCRMRPTAVLPVLHSSSPFRPQLPLHDEFPAELESGGSVFGGADRKSRRQQQDGNTHESLAIVNVGLRKYGLTMGSRKFGKRKGTWKLTAIRDNFWCGPETLPFVSDHVWLPNEKTPPP